MHSNRSSTTFLFLQFQCLQKPKFIPNSHGDRFIPRRYALQLELMTTSYNLFEQESDHVDIFELVMWELGNYINTKHLSFIYRFQKDLDGYWRLHSLRGNIKSTLNISGHDTVLKFHDLITREICHRTLNCNPQIEALETRYKNAQELDWSCTPRPKPLAINDSTHDLPNFNSFTCKFFVRPLNFSSALSLGF